MKTVRILAILVLTALTSPLFLMSGCGESVNGGQCGGCPDSTAPLGSSISVSSLGSAPSATSGTCYPVSFQVFGPDGKPLNNICIELFTDGASAIAKDTGLMNCGDVIANGKTSMITRTNSSGVVILEFLVPPSTTGTTFFVEAFSCSVSAIATTPASK